MKTYNKKTLLVGIVIIIILFSIYTLKTFFDSRGAANTRIEQNSFQSDNTNQNKDTLTIKESTITLDTNNPNISIYTSYSLGIQFRYLNNGKYGLQSKPIESGDKISLDENNYVRVFQKLKDESVEQAIKRLLPQKFQNPNCSVVPDGINKYLIWDKRVPVSYYSYDGILDGTPYEKLGKTFCNPIMDNHFVIDPAFPNTIYYIEYSHQAFDYSANESKSEAWWTTVRLIGKVI